MRFAGHSVSFGFVASNRVAHCQSLQSKQVSSSGSLKIGDFGSAIFKDMQPDGSEGDAVYQAPELFDGNVFSTKPRAHVHSAADVFSLGLMLFEMVTGAPLQKSGALFHHLRRGGGRELLEGRVTRDTQNWIMRMLHTEPEQRPSASEIAEARLWQ